jgi:hypothetical protein
MGVQTMSIVINFTKAQEIKKEMLRADRAPLLAAQDILFQRAIESNTSTQHIVAEKQRLRDITKLVDDAITLDQLKSISI